MIIYFIFLNIQSHDCHNVCLFFSKKKKDLLEAKLHKIIFFWRKYFLFLQLLFFFKVS